MRIRELTLETEAAMKRGREILKTVMNCSRSYGGIKRMAELLDCHRTYLHAVYRDEKKAIPSEIRRSILRNYEKLNISRDILEELIRLWPNEARVLEKIIPIKSNSLGLYVLMSLGENTGKLKSKMFLKTQYSFEFSPVVSESHDDHDVFLHVSDFSEIVFWYNYFPYCYLWEMDKTEHRKSVFVVPWQFRESTKYCIDLYDRIFEAIWNWDHDRRDKFCLGELRARVSKLDLSKFREKGDEFKENFEDHEFAISINSSYFYH